MLLYICVYTHACTHACECVCEICSNAKKKKNLSIYLSQFFFCTQRYVLGGACGVLGGARGVVVIAVGNEHGDTSSNPGRDWLHFT